MRASLGQVRSQPGKIGYAAPARAASPVRALEEKTE